MGCNNPECDSGKPVLAGGLCQRCYWRQRRNGTLQRKRAPNRPGGICATDGCDRTAHAKGYCLKHYQQTIDPMRIVWKVLRSRAQGDFVPSWATFEGFLGDVGQRPGEKYQLRRIDVLKPWGPGNFDWREPIKIGGATTGLTADMASYQWAWNLKRKYGLSPEDAQIIIDHQGGLCPACKQPLGYFGPATRTEATTIVDHDHTYDGQAPVYAVRAIMHRICNSGMGLLGESAANLRAAADILDAHDRRKSLGLSILEEINNGAK